VDPITLQQILDALADDGADVAALLSGEAGQNTDVAELEREALTVFDEIRQRDVVSEEDVAALEQLADAIEALRAEQSRRDEAAAEQQAHIEELASRVAPGSESESDSDDNDGEGGENSDGDGGDAPEGSAGENGGEGEGDGEQDAERPELVNAAGNRPAPARRRRVDLGRVAARRGTPAPPPEQGRPELRAAADQPGYANGHRFSDLEELADAAIRRFTGMPRGGGAPRMQQGVAVIAKEYPSELVASGSGDDMDVIEHAAGEARLQGGSLVAAGGWCAPSETLYELCEMEGTDGLLSIPEIVAARGGVRFTQGPDFASIFSNTGFLQTEADAIAGTQKPCFEIPCPDFEECRLDAIGLCLTAGILQNRGYPEVVARFIRGALKAHAHRYSGTTIARIEAGSTAVTVPGGPGATASVLGAVELQATDYRYRHRMPDNATLEVIAPRWLRGILRSDLAKRNGVDMLSVSNQTLDQYFRDRQVNVQWVYNWQDGFFPTPPTIGGAVPPTGWPTNVKILMFSAGTWVRATADIITLDAVYDSVLFRVNRYNALFTEEGLCVIQRCPDSRVITIPVCPDGATGEQRAQACPTS
jgi:hypothetical protein